MSPWERKPSHHKTVQAKRLTSRQLSQLGLSASNWPPEEVGPTICKRVLARLLSNLRQLCSGSRINKTWKFSLCSEYPWKEANMKIGLCLWEKLIKCDHMELTILRFSQCYITLLRVPIMSKIINLIILLPWFLDNTI